MDAPPPSTQCPNCGRPLPAPKGLTSCPNCGFLFGPPAVGSLASKILTSVLFILVGLPLAVVGSCFLVTGANSGPMDSVVIGILILALFGLLLWMLIREYSIKR